MNRLRRTVALFILAVVCLGQNASIMMNPNVRRVGMRLACLCGVCKNSVGDCQMLGCHYAGGAREKIAQMQSTGASDDNIVAKFVSDTGIKALAVPPASGFSLTAWIMPFAMLALGLYVIYVYVQRMKRAPALAGPAPSAKHQDLAAKNLDTLE